MSDTCWETRETDSSRKPHSWRDLDHHGYDPEWGAVSRYRVYCATKLTMNPIHDHRREIASGKTWEEANAISDGLNERVRRVKGIFYSSWSCRMYLVELEFPSNYPDFCAARHARNEQCGRIDALNNIP